MFLHVHRAILITVTVLCVLAPAVASAQGRPTSSARADSEYRIGPEDVLDIQVWGRSDLKGSAVVDANGRIQLPLLGEAAAAGRTPTELAQDLTGRYQLLDPSVSEVVISITAYNSQAVTVLGEVRTPGPCAFREMPDVWGALFAAGGPTPEADLSQVQVIRTTAEQGESRVLNLDLSLGIDGTPAGSLPALRPKDKIVVPSTAEKAAGPGTFHILGAVRVPGPYRVSAAGTVVEALSVSGGMLPTAALERVYLTRQTPEGVVSYRLNIDGYLKAGKPLANMGLRPGDTLTVPERPRSALLSIVQVLLPIASFALTVYMVTDRRYY